MDFNIDNLWVLNVFGVEVWITRTIFNTWIIMLVLIAIAAIVRVKLRTFEEIPHGFQNAIEAGIEMFDNFVLNTVGEELFFLGRWFFTVFVFLLASSVSSVFGMRPPTADWATTFALAMGTFFLIQIVGIKFRGRNYLKTFIEPNIVFFPLNLIGELARPVSLSFRLFGNVLSGLIIMTLLYTLTPLLVRFGVPAALHAYFDLFMGALQTYIFCVLSLMFVKGATE